MQTSETDDARLVAATRRGDHAAFARIIERYQRPVYAVAFSGVRDRALADDVTQDTFVLAWRRLVELRDPARLPAWLCGIARNLARDARKRRRFETSASPTEAAAAIDATATPFEALDDAQCDRLVAAALADVPDTYREPLVLYYFEDQSVDDVARALGISAETTHRRLSRGRRFLAERTHELALQRMPRRGPRAGLVAGVLAVVGSVAAGSHVEASPLKGLVMPKLVIVTVLVATLGAAGILAADSSRKPPRKPPAKPVATATPVVAPTPVLSTPVTPTPVLATPVTPTPLVPAKPSAAPAKTAFVKAAAAPVLPPATTLSVPDCTAIAKHVAALSVAKFANKPIPRAKLATLEKGMTESTARKCSDQHWSETMRLCMVDADDYTAAMNQCSDEPGATPDELEGLPATLGCKALSEHVFGIARAPDGKFGLLSQKYAASPEDMAKLDALIDKARAALETECDDRPWTVEKRRCVAAAASTVAYADCR